MKKSKGKSSGILRGEKSRKTSGKSSKGTRRTSTSNRSLGGKTSQHKSANRRASKSDRSDRELEALKKGKSSGIQRMEKAKRGSVSAVRGNTSKRTNNKKISRSKRDIKRKITRGKSSDIELAALNKMMLNVLKKQAKKRKKQKEDLWEDFEMDDDILDTEDDY